MRSAIRRSDEAPLPQFMSGVRLTSFLRFRRCFRRITGRELGLAHCTRALARVIPGWHQLALEGPDQAPLYVDLRMKEGYFSTGYRNTIAPLTALLPLVKDNATVIDVGANIGVWSRFLMARSTVSKLVAFEPIGRNFELLQINLGGYRQASCQPYAVGASTGPVSFSRDLDSGQNHVLTRESELVRRPFRTVQMCTLDDWSRMHGLTGVDIIKVDVEGTEVDVFSGAVNTIRQSKPIIYFEYLFENRSDCNRDCLEFLRGLGYTVRRVTGDATDQLTGGLSDDYIALPSK